MQGLGVVDCKRQVVWSWCCWIGWDGVLVWAAWLCGATLVLHGVQQFWIPWTKMVAMQHECTAPLLGWLRWSKHGQCPTIETNIFEIMLASIKLYYHDFFKQYVYIDIYLFIYIDTLHGCKHETPPLHLAPFWELFG